MAVTAPPPEGQASTKTRKPRAKPEGHRVTFFIKDESVYSALARDAENDERTVDNMAALVVRRHYKNSIPGAHQ